MRATPILPVFGLLLGLAVQAAAQEVEGMVVDAATGAGLSGAEVVLRGAEGDVLERLLTDQDGWFLGAAGDSRTVSLTVSRLGYHTFSSDPIPVGSGDRLTLEIRLGVDAIPVEPLLVTYASPRYPPDIQAFYGRLERGRRSGAGRFISRADIEDAYPSRATDLLRSMPSIQVVRNRAGAGDLVRMRGGCTPSIYIDGNYMNRYDMRLSLNDYVAPRSIEGIEVYGGAGRLVGHMNDPRGCGLILVWTRRGEPSDSAPIRWKTVGVALVAVVSLLLLYR